jgi:hypothetical protein
MFGGGGGGGGGCCFSCVNFGNRSLPHKLMMMHVIAPAPLTLVCKSNVDELATGVRGGEAPCRGRGRGGVVGALARKGNEVCRDVVQFKQ